MKAGTLMCLWNEAYGIAYRNDQGKLGGVCIDILEDFRMLVKEKYGVDLAIEFKQEKYFARFLTQIQ